MGEGEAMQRGDGAGWCRKAVRVAILALALAVAGCATDRQRIDAIHAVNEAFRVDYEAILAMKGTQLFQVPRDDAFAAMRVALARAGMHTEDQNESLGLIVAAGKSPLPLDAEEWKTVVAADQPRLQEVIRPIVGVGASFVHFEPQGLETVITASFVPVGRATEVSLTVRLRETAPPQSGWPRREYLPPTAVSMGLDKIWAAFEEDLRVGRHRS